MQGTHRESRIVDLIEYEDEQHKLLEQCRLDPDTLFVDYRFDVACQSLKRFAKLGITLEDLLKFQSEVHRVVLPWSVEYNTARVSVNRRFNVFPLIIVMSKTEEDVIKAFAFSQKYKMEVSLRSGAHCFESYDLCSGMVLCQYDRRSITYSDRTVTIQPGVLIGPLTTELYKHKQMVSIGVCIGNGVTNFSSNGGIGPFTRYLGTGSDNILEGKLLLASGEVVKCNKDEHKDLFFALRGAGAGQYGVILELTLKTHPVNNVWTFVITYKGACPLREWFSFTSNLKVTSDFVGRKTREEIPRLYKKKTETAEVIYYVSGYSFTKSQDKLVQYLKPMLQLKGVVSAKIKYQPFIDAVKKNSGTGRWLPFYAARNGFVSESLPSDAVRVLEEHLERAGDFDYFIFDNLGGKNDEIPKRESAFVHRGHVSWLHIISMWKEQEEAPKREAWLSSLYKALRPYLTYDVYQNLPWSSLSNPLEKYYGENLSKLRRIKTKYDPDNVFHYKQSIPPLSDTLSK